MQNDSFGDSAVSAYRLSKALADESTEAIKTAISRSTLNKEQIRAILIEKNLKDEILETTTAELANTTATNASAASQDKLTLSTTSLGTAFNGLKFKIKETSAAMWAFLTTPYFYTTKYIYNCYI